MRTLVLVACAGLVAVTAPGLAPAEHGRQARAANIATTMAAERAAGDVHRIAVDLQGPLALVTVTRTLAAAGRARADCEHVLDIALPDRAALLSVEIG